MSDTWTRLRKLLEKGKRKRFSEIERDILMQAGIRDGKILIMAGRLGCMGEYVQIAGKKYMSDQDATTRTKALDAFHNLHQLQLIRHDDGNLFSLSESGWELARQLIKKQSE